MANPVAAGVSRISLYNLSEDQVTRRTFVLEVYDGEDRIQVEFDDKAHFLEVIRREPEEMMEYFRNNLFDSPDMDDPQDALTRMAAISGDEGLVTVPPEEEDEVLFDAMTTIFQKTAELSGQSRDDGTIGDNGNFLQSLLRENRGDEREGEGG